jgi:hypothetical protein
MIILEISFFDLFWTVLKKEKPGKQTFYRLLNEIALKICGPDGTRTRDLRRDRAAF